MRSWDLSTHEVEPHRPQVLGTEPEGRAVLINLPAGESLRDHEVRERATVVVVSGRLELEAADSGTITGGPGSMVVFEPSERHAVSAIEDSRFLLLLAPWSLENNHSGLDPWSAPDDL